MTIALKHSARLNLEDRECHLQFVNRLSNFWMFTNPVLQNLQQPMGPGDMVCRLSWAHVCLGLILRWHRRHLCSDSSSVVEETHLVDDPLRR